MNEPKPDYITYGRTFENYKWYKPLLTLVIAGTFLIVFNVILVIIGHAFLGDAFLLGIDEGYEALNTIDISTFITFLSLAMAIPSIYLASRIVRDRPFSSYASTMGGWRWKLYFKCLTVPLLVFMAGSIISLLIDGHVHFENQFTIISFIMFLIMVPLQCIGEEYLFRGLLMQSLGSWVKTPIVALILQAVIFGLLHEYNSIGVFAIILSGVLYGWTAWKTDGIEASSAIHSINNLFVLMLAGFGLQQTSSTVTVPDLVLDAVVQVACVVLLYYVGKKYEWF